MAAAEPATCGHASGATNGHAPPLSEQDVWRLVLQNEGLLRRETRAHMAPHRRRAEFEDMYADVVLLRAHRIMRLFDPSRGVKPITYLVKNCKWYAMEWCLGRKYKKRVPTESMDTRYGDGGADQSHPPCRESAAQQLSQETSSLLARLPEELAEVLAWCCLKGYTPLEVSDHLGVPTRTVREMLGAARFLARFYSAGEGDFEE